MSALADTLNQINDAIWLVPFALVILIGIYATLRFKGIQFAKVGEMCRVSFRKKGGDYSGFRVFLVSVGTKVGAGNITGPILAILTGGPGAIFWMWIFALIGAATAFLESTVSQIYKQRNDEGGFDGGPAYNVLHALCRPKLALAIALLFIVMQYVGFTSMEACTISEAVNNVFSFEGSLLVFSLILAVLLGIVVIGGFKRISDLSNILVPGMVVVWVIICAISIALSKGGILNAFGMIFDCAFNVPALVGGGVGTMLMIGMKRGILSNEAGLGTSTCISSIADVDHPVEQGLSQSLAVIMDVLICTVTALVILSYGSYEQIMATGLESQALLQHVFESTLGPTAAFIVMVFVFVFTFTSMLGTFAIGLSNVRFVSKEKKAFYAAVALMLIVTFLSSLFASDELFTVVDMLLAVTATVNCIVLIFIGGCSVAAYRDYFRQRKEGKEVPVFSKSVLDSTEGVTSWD